MIATKEQHPLFLTKFRSLGTPWLAKLANTFLSAGGMCYVINDGGIKTRIYLHNYFALLNGGPFRVAWKLELYSSEGKLLLTRKGEMMHAETLPIEMDALSQDIGPVGICMVHIDPLESSFILRNSYMTHFFIEYYTSKAESLMHSCGHLIPKVHKVTDYIASSIRRDSEAILLVSNSCYRRFHYPKKLLEKGVTISFKNHRGELLHHDLDPIMPLASRKVDLRRIWPQLDDFLDNQPALIQVCGPNVFYSPLVIQMKPDGYIAMDHVQGGDWDDYDDAAAIC
jgi:hypothetical protein